MSSESRTPQSPAWLVQWRAVVAWVKENRAVLISVGLHAAFLVLLACGWLAGGGGTQGDRSGSAQGTGPGFLVEPEGEPGGADQLAGAKAAAELNRLLTELQPKVAPELATPILPTPHPVVPQEVLTTVAALSEHYLERPIPQPRQTAPSAAAGQEGQGQTASNSTGAGQGAGNKVGNGTGSGGGGTGTPGANGGKGGGVGGGKGSGVGPTAGFYHGKNTVILLDQSSSTRRPGVATQLTRLKQYIHSRQIVTVADGTISDTFGTLQGLPFMSGVIPALTKVESLVIISDFEICVRGAPKVKTVAALRKLVEEGAKLYLITTSVKATEQPEPELLELVHTSGGDIYTATQVIQGHVANPTQ